MKNKRKFTKIILAIIALVFLCWLAIFVTDMIRTYNLKEPIFAKKIEVISNDSNIMYDGLGYEIEIELSSEGTKYQIISSTMYMFNKVVAGAIT